MSVSVTEGVERILLIYGEILCGNEDGAGGAQGNVAVPGADRTGAHSGSSIVTGAGSNDGIRREAQLCRGFRPQCAHGLIAFMQRRQHFPRNAADLQHLRGPLPVFDVQKQHAGGIGEICGEGAAQHVAEVVLRQHDLSDPAEALRLMLLQPEQLGGGEAREGNVGGAGGKFIFTDGLIQVVGFRLGAAVVPENGRADHLILIVQDHQTVHLAAEAEPLDLLLRDTRTEPGDAPPKGGEPVLRILLGPARLREGDRVDLGDHILNSAVFFH